MMTSSQARSTSCASRVDVIVLSVVTRRAECLAGARDPEPRCRQPASSAPSQNSPVSRLLDHVLTTVTGAVRALGRHRSRARTVLGHSLHPVLTDLPLGCWTSATLIDLVGGQLGPVGGDPAGRARPALGRPDGVRRPRLVEPAARAPTVGSARCTRSATTWRSCCSRARSWPGRAAQHGRGVRLALLGNLATAAAGHLGGHLALEQGHGGPLVSGEIPGLTRGRARGAPARTAARRRCARRTRTCRTTATPSTTPGVTPDDLHDARRPRPVPVHGQGRPARELPVRHVRGAARAGGARARVQRYDGQADRRRLHPRGHRHLGRGDGPVDPGGRRSSRRRRATWPTATGCSPAGSARTTAPSGSAARSSRSAAG